MGEEQGGGNRAEARRQRIIAAARILFVANGFHATGVAQIAKESGVAVGQIYRDFASKEDIVAAIVQADCQEFLEFESLQRGIVDGDIDLIWRWIADFLDSGREDSDPLLGEIIAECARNDRIAAVFDTIRGAVESAMYAALAALAPGDQLAERRKALADLLMAMSLGITQHRLIAGPNSTGSDGQIAELALEMVRQEIAAMRAAQCGKDMAA